MGKLEDLKIQRARLDREIADLEKAESERLRDHILTRDYVRVACPDCSGLGAAARFGADNTDVCDYPCESCAGRGFLYGRLWKGNQEHDMEHNQVATP